MTTIPPELSEKISKLAFTAAYGNSKVTDLHWRIEQAIIDSYPLIREHVMREEQAKLVGAQENAKRLALKVCAELADKMLSEIAGGENVGFAIRNLMIPKIDSAMKEGK